MRIFHRLTAFCKRHTLAGLVLAAVLLFCLNIVRYLVWPPVAYLARENPDITSFMAYRQAEWTEKKQKKTIRRTWRALNRISPHLRKAVVIAEDGTFWTHDGFDLEGMQAAMERNIAKGRLAAGGSTISQQLAKNLFFTPEKTLVRKLQEALVTWRLEQNLTKERILELYLNVVEWGEATFGAEAASRRYFGISAAKLSDRQAAELAAMLPAPLRRTPDSPLVQRIAGILLRRMERE